MSLTESEARLALNDLKARRPADLSPDHLEQLLESFLKYNFDEGEDLAEKLASIKVHLEDATSTLESQIRDIDYVLRELP